MSDVKPFIEEQATAGRDRKWSAKSFRVGAHYRDGDLGSVAEVYIDEDWVHIVTDGYEGHAMLHLQTIPLLRRALLRLEKERKSASTAKKGKP